MTYTMQIPEEMRKKYLERRLKDFSELSTALERNELEVFKRIGHQLKGNAPTFGYDELAILGQNMEVAAESNDKDFARECLSKLQSWISSQPLTSPPDSIH